MWLINIIISAADSQLKYDYLMILYQVVDESTVCLMGHERRQTLDMILELAGQIYQPEYCSDSQLPGSSYCTPGQETGSWSSASSTTSGQTWASTGAASSHSQTSSNGSWTGSSSSSSSSSSSGQYSPMSTSSSCSPSLSPKPAEMSGDVSSPVTLLPHKFTVPPPTHAPPPAPPTSYQAPPPQCPPPTITVHNTSLPPPVPAPHCISTNQNIPTYEIVTSCQPSVIYSNGYYYTSFSPPTPSSTGAGAMGTVVSQAPVQTPCYTCSCNCGAPGAPVGAGSWTISAPPPVAPAPGSWWCEGGPAPPPPPPPSCTCCTVQYSRIQYTAQVQQCECSQCTGIMW